MINSEESSHMLSCAINDVLFFDVVWVLNYDLEIFMVEWELKK